MTGDLDIILTLSNENILKFISVCKTLSLIPRLPVEIEDFADEKKRSEWVKEKNMKVFSVYNPENPLEHVDVKIDFEENISGYISNSQKIMADDINIYIVSIDDLITLKKEAGRDRDLVDIRALERIKELKND